MASGRSNGRLYRDYYSSKNIYATASPTNEPNGSKAPPRTVLPIRGDEGQESLGRTFSNPRIGEARTFEQDESPSSFPSDPSELTLGGNQPYTAPWDSSTALPAMPNELKMKHREVATSPRLRQSSPPPQQDTSSGVPPIPRGLNGAVRSPKPSDVVPDAVPKEGPAEQETDHIANMPEFFSQSVFHTALYNPTISHQLLKFCQSRLCGENIEFLTRVHMYRKKLQEVSQAMSDIYGDFLSEGAASSININESTLMRVNGQIKSSLATAMPQLESVFNSAQTEIEQLVYGFYPTFVRHQMSLSAAKALGADRAKYAGLGDCFVLTDPAKADNPIVFASDGFVKVTGYGLAEIIPRNCRFLQSYSTNRAVIQRIKEAVVKREESVELLLNCRKDGEPFWNLLYTTPLFDANGKLVFFLGGQINCSTTVHNASDVLKILAQSEDKAVNTATIAQQKTKTSKGRMLLGNQNRPEVPQSPPGMEDGLRDRLEGMPLQGQFETFYTAYSKFLVVNYSTFLIAFVSTGILDMLFPIKTKTPGHAAAAGTDIFKFLSNHGTGSLGWEFKSTVKSALKAGRAITLDIKLCARPYMGIEKFLCHWTPLKDEKGAVSWVVLTLGNDQRI